MDSYPFDQDLLINFASSVPSLKKQVLQDEGVIKYVHKTDMEKGGTIADKNDLTIALTKFVDSTIDFTISLKNIFLAQLN